MDYPSNMIFLIIATAIGLGFTYWFFIRLYALKLFSIEIAQWWQIGAAVFFIGMFSLAAFFSMTDRYTADIDNQGVFVALPITLIVGFSLALFIWPPYRRLLDMLPMHWLIISHVLRVVPGVIFVALEDMGLLPYDAALQAGYGDIIAGVTALGVAYIVYERWPQARPIALIWNLFGLLDLFNALYSGLTTFPSWLIMLSNQNQDIQFINLFLLLPTFSVPLFIVTHIILFYKLWRRTGNSTTVAVKG